MPRRGGQTSLDGAVLPLFITPSYFATAKGIEGLSVDPESSAVDFVFVTAKD